MSEKQLLEFERLFTSEACPDDNVTWTSRDAVIRDAAGNILFEQKDVQFPDFWSDSAVNITVHKYFKGLLGSDRREVNLKQVVNRVVQQITDWGVAGGYFDTLEAVTFHNELSHIITYQMASFNSPVWFNCGVLDETSSGYCWQTELDSDSVLLGYVRKVKLGEHKPQCSACFITAPDDDMASILDWVKTEGMIFKHGSGSGCNISKIRSSKEMLSSGGQPSGPLAFMQIADQAAGSIKSGGKHRRAAKLVCMDADHPDILEFIDCKSKEEFKARKLIAAGWSAEFNDPENAYSQVFYQNTNHSVVVPDSFMKAVEQNASYATIARTSGRHVESLSASKILRKIATAAFECGDPGIQFGDQINAYNTVANTEPIRSSNPCGEYLFLDNTACNLASINLLKFLSEDGTFDITGFVHTVKILITAQDILVDNAGYPTELIARRSHTYRTLGLGFANLGALLMACGLSYDSDAGRSLAGAIASLMTATAYKQSAALGTVVGPFENWQANVLSFSTVLLKHVRHSEDLVNSKKPISHTAYPILAHALHTWEDLRTVQAMRNAQVTVIAPTGTIGFMMDCDTTGIEPELALVKYKKLVGGGSMRIVNSTVTRALSMLKYGAAILAIKAHLESTGSMEDANIKKEDLAVFDTSFPATGKTRCIPYMAHLYMMAAVQPFISGGISKTVNMPATSTVADIVSVYLEAWRLGLKSVTVYRDGCKQSQPLSTKEGSTKVNDLGNTPVVSYSDVEDKIVALLADETGRTWLKEHGLVTPEEVDRLKTSLEQAERRPYQRKLPATRQSICHKFRIANHTGYLHVGLFNDGKPGELFLRMAKEGSTISGLIDAFATAISFNLQYGVPLDKLVQKFKYMKFEPSGYTHHETIRLADSIVDYIFKFLELEFLTPKLDLNQGTPIVVESAQVAQMSSQEFDANIQRRTDEVSTGEVIRWLEMEDAKQAPAVADSLSPRPATDAPLCADCGMLMVRNGSCFKCSNCGGTSGCS